MRDLEKFSTVCTLGNNLVEIIIIIIIVFLEMSFNSVIIFRTLHKNRTRNFPSVFSFKKASHQHP